jgi:hypothetical protein
MHRRVVLCPLSSGQWCASIAIEAVRRFRGRALYRSPLSVGSKNVGEVPRQLTPDGEVHVLWELDWRGHNGHVYGRDLYLFSRLLTLKNNVAVGFRKTC